MIGRIAAFVLLGMSAAAAQQLPIVGQDPATADRGRGATGWVQAPVPRGYNAPQQTAQGAGSSTSGAPQVQGGQGDAANNPGTPVNNPNPGPSGGTTDSPRR